MRPLNVALIEQENLFDYFQVRVDEAHLATRPGLSGEARLYLVHLLTERARTDRQEPDAATLAELHALACRSRPAGQVRNWRELGDRALFGLGTCREHLARKPVSLGYYEDMGRAAYARVDRVVKAWFADAFGPLFRELAERFQACVDLLEHVRAAHEEEDIGTVLQHWQQTGDPTAATWLQRRGLILVRASGED